MNNFSFSKEESRAELDKASRRNLTKERLFILILGPSASGKSTIINELNVLTSALTFAYVKPMITRANRPEESDKISVTNSEFDAMEKRGDFVVVNSLYGDRYGTPLRGILEPLGRGSLPILDYPLQTVHDLRRPEYDILSFYIYPPSVEEWRKRIEDSGRNVGGRVEAGLDELAMLDALGFVHPDIDISILSNNNEADVAARRILETIIEVTA